MLPPMGAIIIGPCPECKGLVVVFCGHVLPLENEIMVKGSFPDKHEHLMSVLTDFLSARVDKLLQEEPEGQEQARADEQTDEEEPQDQPKRRKAAAGGAPEPAAAITQEEVDAFVNVDLKLLDDKNYFQTIFG